MPYRTIWWDAASFNTIGFWTELPDLLLNDVRKIFSWIWKVCNHIAGDDGAVVAAPLSHLIHCDSSPR